jgi:hypothetical protein
LEKAGRQLEQFDDLLVMVGLTSLIVSDLPMLPRLDPKRARLIIAKIDNILAWENSVENTRDSKFVDLGKHLCEVRAGQYWRMEQLKSFDEFLEKRFPESRRKSLLPDVHPRALAQADQERLAGDWLGQGR